MKRNDWKYLIDALVFVVFCSIAAIGSCSPSWFRGKRARRIQGFHGTAPSRLGDIHFNLALFLMGLIYPARVAQLDMGRQVPPRPASGKVEEGPLEPVRRVESSCFSVLSDRQALRACRKNSPLSVITSYAQLRAAEVLENLWCS